MKAILLFAASQAYGINRYRKSHFFPCWRTTAVLYGCKCSNFITNRADGADTQICCSRRRNDLLVAVSSIAWISPVSQS